MNTTITFPRPTVALLSMNDRHHWARRKADVKAWRGAATVAYQAAYHDQPQPPSWIYTTVDVPDNRRRDPSNFFPCVKAIVDGLVDAECWLDDTPDYVTVIEPKLRVVKGGPLMVQVELRPREH